MRFIISCLTTVLLVTPCFAGETVKFVFDAQPGALLISPKADGFSAYRSSSTSYSYRYNEEKIEGVGSVMPNARIGLGINSEVLDLDVTAGPGYLWNAAFSAPFLRADVSGKFKLGPVVTVGPHAGVLYFDAPKWSGDAQLDFSSTTGVMGGVDFTVGKKISFLASVDYVNANFDVKPKAGSGWQVSDKSLDISGIA